MVGVAPGGIVAVWVTGRKTVEVLFDKAHKAEVNWSKAIDYPEAKRVEFVKMVVEDSVKPEILASIRKNGIQFNQWANYRKLYHWMPTFVGEKFPKYINVIYFNGENNRLNFPLNETIIGQSRPVPDEISFSYLIKGETEADVFIIHFDKDEIFSAFAKLGSKQELLRFEFEPKLPKSATKVRLYNDKECIQLTKWTIEEW